jgi:hypothetical protein
MSADEPSRLHRCKGQFTYLLHKGGKLTK